MAVSARFLDDGTIINLCPPVRKHLPDTCGFTEESIHVPKTYTFDNLGSAKNCVKGLGIESQGLVLKLRENKGKNLWRNLFTCRLIKGNNSKLLERYLHVRKNRQIKIYLRYFPEATDKFENII